MSAGIDKELGRRLVLQGVSPTVAFKRVIAAARAARILAETSGHGLTPFQRAILEHWKVYRPGVVAELARAGTLRTSVVVAANRTLDAEAAALRSGLSPDQARELLREEWAFLPEEGASEPDDSDANDF